MKRKPQGRYVPISTTGEKAKAFVPAALPPNPPVDWTPALHNRYDQALLALGRLDSVSTLLPDTSLFINMYVRKEAVLSSMIEGTQSSLSDLLLFELEQTPGVPLDDVQEVSNYVAALNHGLSLLNQGLPLSLRLIKEVHEKLLNGGRGSAKTPGGFRRSQNWIGGSRPGNATFVPPPAEAVAECMGQLESFLNDVPASTPVLLKAALAHVQFETIHPFLDGNGRVGRLLITLQLCKQQVLRSPMLYLSLYFKSHRETYYELLNNVRQNGDWETWLEFFSQAVEETASQALETAQQLLQLADTHREQVSKLGKAAASTLAIYRALMERPISSSNWLVEKTGLTPATVNKSLVHLENLGIVTELTAQKRNRIFSYNDYIVLMSRGTELL